MPQKPPLSKAAPKKAAATARKETKLPQSAKRELRAKAREEQVAQLRKKSEELGLTLLNWEPERLAHFLGGNLTLAGLENVSKQQLYDMADVGYRLMTQGKLSDAEKIFSGLTVMDPYDSYFQLALGSIFQRMNDFTRAEQHYTRAIDVDAQSITGYVNRGEVRIMMRKYSDAIDDFSRATQLDPEARDAAAMRARVMLIALNNKVKEARAKVAQGA